jgi:hypothetical protein
MLSQPRTTTTIPMAPRVAPVARFTCASRPGTFSLLKSGEMGGSGRQVAAYKGRNHAFADTNAIARGRSLNPENRSSV